MRDEAGVTRALANAAKLRKVTGDLVDVYKVVARAEGEHGAVGREGDGLDRLVAVLAAAARLPRLGVHGDPPPGREADDDDAAVWRETRALDAILQQKKINERTLKGKKKKVTIHSSSDI